MVVLRLLPSISQLIACDVFMARYPFDLGAHVRCVGERFDLVNRGDEDFSGGAALVVGMFQFVAQTLPL
jgi:hypothetical protein